MKFPGLLPNHCLYSLRSHQLDASHWQRTTGSALAYLAVDAAEAGTTGEWFDAYPAGKHQLAIHDVSPEAREEAKQRRLWELSAQLVGVPA